MKYSLFILYLLLGCYNSKGQLITTYAGNGQPNYSGDGGLAVNAGIGFPGLLAFDKFQNLYITELNNTIRKVSSTGIISTIAGTGSAGYSGDGDLAINAEFDFTGGGGMVCDTLGNLYIADQANNRVRKIDMATGIVTTIAGTGIAGFSGDGGPATLALFNSPIALAFDSIGSLYVLDGFNYRIRKIDVAGMITTIAGTGTLGVSGDGGPAINAQITSAGVISIDHFNNLLIAEGLTIRRINLSTGIISTIAGNGTGGYNGDGILATNAQLATTLQAVSDVQGNIYISDGGNRRVRKVGVDNIIYTVVGTGIQGYDSDSVKADTARLHSPRGIALDSCGNLYIADNGNRRIRKVTFNDSCGEQSTNAVAGTRLPSFSIYPNPARDEVTVNSNAPFQSVIVSNYLGQALIRRNNVQGKTVLDVSALLPGVYFITVTDESRRKVTQKILKE